MNTQMGNFWLGVHPPICEQATAKCIAVPAFVHNNQHGTVWSARHLGKSPGLYVSSVALDTLY